MADVYAVAGDWHGDLGLARPIVTAAADAGVKLILHAGDFGIWPGPAGRNFLDQLTALLDDLDMSLWFVDGNHEDFDRLLELPIDPSTGRRPVTSRIDHLPRGHRWQFGDTTWLACGGAVSVDVAYRIPHVSWWPQETITDADVAQCIDAGPADVLLAHDAPWRSSTLRLRYARPSSWPKEALARSDASQRQIDAIVQGTKVSTVFHGHHHHRYTEHTDGVTIHGLGCDGLRDNVVLVGPDGAQF